MRRFLRHVYAVRCCLLGAASLVVVVSAFAAARASEMTREEKLTMPAQADRATVLREHAGWDRNCEAIVHPSLYLNAPPRHGSVCARIENITIKSMVVGTEAQCIGREVRGVRLIYRPDAGFSGGDDLSYAVQYPSVRRAIALRVTVAAERASQPVAALPSPPRQAAGPVPPCTELMF